MESSKAGPINDSSLLESSIKDEVVANYEDCNSEVIDEDQAGEQILGYLEVQGHSGSEDATIILDSQGFNLNGQRLILTQNDGNRYHLVMVSDDPNDPPLDQALAHASGLHTDAVSFDDELKEHGALVVDDESQGLEQFIETEEVPQENEESHIYIENSSMVNVSSENHCPVNSMKTESSVWLDGDQLKSSSTEMIFLPNSAMVSSAHMLSPEDTKHPKLMQLACIAGLQLQSVDQKNCNIDTKNDTDSPLIEIENSVVVAQNGEPENLVLTIPKIKDPQTIDNAVSVIHTTFSELQENLEREMEHKAASKISSVVNFNTTEKESDLSSMYAEISKVSLSDDFHNCNISKPLEVGCDILKPIEDCVKGIKEQIPVATTLRQEIMPANVLLEKFRMSVDSALREEIVSANITFKNKRIPTDITIEEERMLPDVKIREETMSANVIIGTDINTCDVNLGERRVLDDATSLKERMPEVATLEEKKMPVCATLEDGKISVNVTLEDERMAVPEEIHKSKTSCELYLSPIHSPIILLQKSQDLDVLNIADTAMDDNGSHVASCTILVQDNEAKQDSNKITDTVCIHEQETGPKFDQRTDSENLKVLNERDSEYNFTENDIDYVSGSKSTFSILPSRYSVFSRKSKVKTLFSTVSSNVIPHDSEFPTHISCMDSECDSVKFSTFSSQQDLTIENISVGEDSKCNTVTGKIDSPNQQISLSTTFEAQSSRAVEDNKISENLTPEKESFHSQCTKQSKHDKSLNDNVSRHSVCSNSKNLEDNSEETLVKPPKKTYIKKKDYITGVGSTQDKIELFSECGFNLSECDKDIQKIQNSVNIDQQENLTSDQNSAEPALSYSIKSKSSVIQDNIVMSTFSQDNHSTSDDLLSNVRMKVSATYDRRKKTLLAKKDMKSLRPRSFCLKKPHLNDTAETSSIDIQITNFDRASPENLPWGDVLMSTQFLSPGATSDATSTVKDSLPSPKSSLSSEKQKRFDKRKRLSNKINSDFDSLLSPQSSKSKTKCIKIQRRKYLNVGKKAKKDKSRHDTSVHSISQRTDYSNNTSQSVIKKSQFQGVKKAEFSYSVRPKKSSEKGHGTEELNYSCSSCDFASSLVDNLIEHLKYCAKSLPPIDFSVDDMEKRQRIRGEDLDTLRSEGFREYIHSSLEAVRGECSGLSHNPISDSEDEDMDVDLDFMKSKYGYVEDDVVWVKVEDRFWPGLVCELTERKAFVQLINYPSEKKGLKKNAERVHTFDDAKWNKMLLREAEDLPNNETFVKAVQTSETFVRKKWLGQNVKGKEFFSIPNEIEFATDNESSDCNINEDSDCEMTLPSAGIKPSRRARCENIDVEKIKKYIIEGHLDDYAISIYRNEVYSKKHNKYFKEGRANFGLTRKSWFGPCENILEQGILVDYFHTLFLNKIGEKYFFLSYILQVWIPEVIVKAISALQNITQKEAEELFESEDNVDNVDLSIADDLEKMYS